MDRRFCLGIALLFFFVHSIHAVVYTRVANPAPNAWANQRVAGNDDANNPLLQPVNLAFAPDGRIFVAEKNGRVRIIDTTGTLLVEPWIDLRAEVNGVGDRGLIGITLHPDFATNGYVYLLYTEDPVIGEPDEDEQSVTQGVLARYTEDAGTRKANLNSLVKIIGATYGSGFPQCHASHAVGSVEFGLDGTLFVSSGDGSHWDRVDWGNNINQYDPVCEQMFGAFQDTGVVRSQQLESMAGKILRIQPDAPWNGIGATNFPNLVPNPYFEAANPGSVKSRIWASGLRNHFRVAVRRDTQIVGPGTLYMGDVGWQNWEEVNVARFGGENFGWPCYNGDRPVPEYIDAGYGGSTYLADFCAQNVPFLQANHPEATQPFLYWQHQVWFGPYNTGNDNPWLIGNAAASVVVYNGVSYPPRYSGDVTKRAIFFSDFGGQWIRAAWVDENDNLLADQGVEDFLLGVGSITALKEDPISGNLFYTVMTGDTGEVRQIVYLDSNRNYPPDVYAAADVTFADVAVTGPLTVHFSSDGTNDPEGDPLLFEWDFGDGSAVSYNANPTHVYNTAGIFEVTLTVTDSAFQTATQGLIITTNNAPPVVTIDYPPDNFEFSPNIQYNIQSTATDPEGQALTYDWEVRVVHTNHWHPRVASNPNADWSFTLWNLISEIERNSAELRLTVTDAGGASSNKWVRIRPIGMTNQAPVASFTMNPIAGDAPLQVYFSAIDSVDPDIDFLYYYWNWGDGNTGEGRTQYHVFDAPGTYTVTLSIEDIFDVRDTYTQQITVGAGTASPPFFDPPPGSYFGNVGVSLRTTTRAGAPQIKYTIDGSDPLSSNTAILYNNIFYIGPEAVTVKARTFATGLTTSALTQGDYTFGDLDTTGLVGYWSFDRISQNRAPDCSDSGNEGVLYGATVVPGYAGNAVSFNGINNYVEVGDVPELAINSDLTILVWVKLADPNYNAPTRIVSKKQIWNAADGYDLEYNAGANTLRLLGGADNFCESINVDLDAEWHHIAITATGGQCHMYIDGLEVTSEPTIGVIQAGVWPFFIGSAAFGDVAFNGAIDELFIWNRVLPEALIQAFASNPVQPNNQAPVVSLGAPISTPIDLPLGLTCIYVDDCFPRTQTYDTSIYQQSGPANATVQLVSDSSVRVTFSTPGSYVFRCDVSDGASVGTHSITVTVRPPEPLAPVFSPNGGYFRLGNIAEVSIQARQPLTTIHYTIDGSTPTTSSPIFNDPILLNETTTVRAISVVQDLGTSVDSNATFTFLDVSAGLIAYYQFEEEYGFQQVEDLSGNGNHGNLYGTALPTFQPGIFRQSLFLEQPGVGDQYVDAGAMLDLYGDVSIAAWVKVLDPTQTGAMKIASKKLVWNDPTGFELEIRPGDREIALVGAGQSTARATNMEFSADEWHHVVGTIDGNVGKIYFDGVDVTRDSFVYPPIQAQKRLLIGSNNDGAIPAGGAFFGYMDELRIYNIAIPAEMVEAIYRGSCDDGYCFIGSETCSSCQLDCGECPTFDTSSSAVSSAPQTSQSDGSDSSQGDGSDTDGDADEDENEDDSSVALFAGTQLLCLISFLAFL